MSGEGKIQRGSQALLALFHSPTPPPPHLATLNKVRAKQVARFPLTSLDTKVANLQLRLGK